MLYKHEQRTKAPIGALVVGEFIRVLVLRRFAFLYPRLKRNRHWARYPQFI